MKKLAKKLYKLQLKDELVNNVHFLVSVENFKQFIRINLHAHSNRMHMYRKLNPQMAAHNLRIARKRLHTWLNDLEAGVVNYL